MSPRVLAASFALLAAALAVTGCGHRAAQKTAARAYAAPGADFGRGKAVYQAQCAACHGEHGSGTQIGPSLQNENARRSYRAVYAIVRDPAPPMPKLYPARMSKSDLQDVSAYVESL